MLRISCLLLSLLLASVSFAKTLSPSLMLVRLNPIKTIEEGGDELYLDIMAYPSKGKPISSRVPEFPLVWPSKHLDKLTDVKLWKEPLADGESVTLIISLIERDAPPWNTDDLIGSMRVRLKNDKGSMVVAWSLPNRVDAPMEVVSRFKSPLEKFNLLGEYGNYEVFLRLDEKSE